MTSRELKLRDLTEELELKKRYLNQIQKEILALEEELETCQDPLYQAQLCTFRDFLSVTTNSYWCAQIGAVIRPDAAANTPYAYQPTVYDLVHSSPQELLQVKGFGKARLKKVEDWMAKHGLSFIS